MDFKEIKKRCLYEDNHVLVFNKQAGIPVQADKTGDLSLLDLLKAYIKERDAKQGNVYLGLVHRIDRPVSGLVVFAKSSKALPRLSESFRERKVKKIYHAVVFGIPTIHEQTLRHFHRKDGTKNIALLSNKERGDSKPAILHYKLLKHLNEYSLLKVTLETGRFHQIRAQLFKNGNPIVGDLKYGAKKPNPDKSVCLHAYKITIPHPVKDELIVCEAPYPRLQVWDNFK